MVLYVSLFSSIFISVYLSSIYSAYLRVSISVLHSLVPSVSLPICLLSPSLYLWSSMYLFLVPSLSPSVFYFLSLFTCSSVYLLHSLVRSVSPPICLPSLFLYLWFDLYLRLSVFRAYFSISGSICISAYLSFQRISVSLVRSVSPSICLLSVVPSLSVTYV